MIQGLCRVVVCSAVTIVAATAEQSTEDWLKELSAAYAKQEGFIATYTSQAEGKSLEVTIGVENKAGLLLFHMIGKQNGQVHEVKQWNTPDDQYYVLTPEGLGRAHGVAEEVRSLTSVIIAFQSFMGGKPEQEIAPLPRASLVLHPATVEVNVGFGTYRDSPWKRALADAKIRASDQETVTFSTVNHGELTFNRVNGLLTRQSIKGTKGEDRVLIAENVRLNPGKEALLQLSSDWDTDAKASPAYNITRTLRAETFQGIVDGVEQRHLSLEKLDAFLTKHHDLLQQFANTCYLAGPDRLSVNEIWKRMLDFKKDELRKTWQEKNPDAKADQDKAFGVYLTDPKIRNASREDLLAQFIGKGVVREPVMKEIFIDQPRPQGKTEDGKAAAEKIQNVLTRAYVSVILDHKMTELWGEPAEFQ